MAKSTAAEKSVYTTAQAARVCNVSPSTLFRAIRNRQIKAFSTPGGHFRVAKEDLDTYLVESGMTAPLPPTRRKVLVLEENPAERKALARSLEKEPSLDLRTAPSLFELGYQLSSFAPDLVVISPSLPGALVKDFLRFLHAEPSLRQTRVVSIAGARGGNLPKEIQVIAKPQDAKSFIAALDVARN